MALTNKSLIAAFLGLSLLLTGCSSPEQKEANYIKRGNKLFDQGAYEKARIEYKNAARIKPTDWEVRYRIGLVDEAEGNLHAALSDFLAAEQQNAHYKPALLKLGKYFMAANQYDESQKRLDVVFSDSPDEPEAHAIEAGLDLRKKDFPAAETEARAALSKDPANITAYSVLTGLYNAEDDEAKAEATITDGIAHNPNDLSLLLIRADLAQRTKDIVKIKAAYDAIFKLRPKESRFRADLAAIELKLGQTDDAEATLRAGVAVLPDDWDMKRALVNFLSDMRGVDVAEKEVRTYMQDAPDNQDLIFWLVDLYVTHNAADKAVKLLQSIVDQNRFDRLDLRARTSLARIDYIQGDKKTAEELAAAVLNHDPGNHDALFIRANIENDRADYQSAVSDLRSILHDEPRSRDTLQLLSEVLLRQGHLDLAIDTMNQLIEVDPTNVAARVRLAQFYNLNGDPKRALDMLFLITKAVPKYPIGWESAARIAIEQKDWTSADQAIHSLDAIEGQHMTVLYLEAQVLASTGKGDEAIARYTQVINANPSSPLAERALISLVNVSSNTGKLENAVHYIEGLKTESPNISTILGECYVKLNKPEAAAAAFDKAIAAHAVTQDPYLNRAKLYIDNKKPDEAIAILQKAVVADPSDIRGSMMEASALTDLNKYNEAIALYEDLLQRHPAYDIAANNLAEIIADYQYNDTAALEKARQIAERFSSTNNPLMLDTLSWVYYRQGNLDKAQAVMEQMKALKTKLPPEIHYHDGLILLKAGKPSEAKEELQQAVVEGASYPGLDQAKKTLQGL